MILSTVNSPDRKPCCCSTINLLKLLFILEKAMSSKFSYKLGGIEMGTNIGRVC